MVFVSSGNINKDPLFATGDHHSIYRMISGDETQFHSGDR